MSEVAWVELDGAVNVRDLAGLTTADDRVVRPGRLVRSDNLQSLSADDLTALVDGLGVRSVVDLRTDVEVRKEGPGPITGDPRVEIRHLSLFPEAGENTDAAAPDVLPWMNRPAKTEDGRRRTAADVYLGYLRDRPDNIVEALRTIAGSPGATLVHCAAGKDRTGVIVALALTEVGVGRDAVVADYVRTGDRIAAILDRLRASDTYAEDLAGHPDPATHRPRAETIEGVLDALDRDHGGVGGWLRAHGWTEADAAALRAKLLE